MRATVVLLSMLVLTGSSWAQDIRPGPAIVLGNIAQDIRDARELAKSSTDLRLREQLDLLLARAELATRELQRGATQPAPGPARPVAMSSQDFTRFLAALSANKFDDARLATVKTLGNARLTAAQGKQVLQKFSFDKGKEDAAVALYPMLVDPHLFALVLEAMTFEQNRANAIKRVTQ